eukprot:12915220-Prorocentrum_lima.AAC.1
MPSPPGSARNSYPVAPSGGGSGSGGASSGAGGGSGTASGAATQAGPHGDWYCSSCNFKSYVTRKACYRCALPRFGGS